MSIFKEMSQNIGYFEQALRKTQSDIVFDGKYGPIVGVHGMFGSWTEEGIKKYMIEKNVKGVLTNFELLTGGIDLYLPRLEKVIETYPQALIVGYSAGGVLALRYAQIHGFENIEKIITVATPFKGLHKLFALSGRTAVDIQRGSKILDEVLKFNPPQGKVLSVFAESEYFTPDPKRIRLNWPKVIIPASSHGEIQEKSLLIESILDSGLGFNSGQGLVD
jgi:hypothetical protein